MLYSQYPLQLLFEQLRKNGFPLGVAEYEDFLYALDKEFLSGKPDSYEALRQLTRLVWFTPGHSRELFDELFNLYWNQVPELKENVSHQPRPINNPSGESQFRPEDTKESNFSVDDKTEEAIPTQKTNQNIETSVNTPQAAFWLSLKSSQMVLDEENTNVENKDTSSVIRLGGGYFPVNQRALSLVWRLLRIGGNKIQSNELNIIGTVDRYARNADFIVPVYKKNIHYSPRFVVLIDQSPSMAAFHDFSIMMAKNSPIDAFSDLPTILYFSNVPETYLYGDIGHQKEFLIRNLRRSFEKRQLRIMVISDAGAARGCRSRSRIIATQRALKAMAPFTKNLVWINPMPKHRWQGSSAKDIASMVPMVEASDQGMVHAVNILRGKTSQQSIGV